MTAYDDLVDSFTPVAHLKLGEPSGGPYTDRKGHTVNVAAGAAPVLVSSDLLNNAGDGATQVNTTTDMITIVSAADLLFNDTFTLLCWFKRSAGSFGAFRTLLSKQTNSWTLTINPTDQLEFRKSGVAAITTAAAAWTDTTNFHLAAVTKSGATSHLYFDRADVTGTVVDQDLVDSALDVQVGRFSGGVIDEVSLFNHVLSLTDIQAIYDMGTVAARNQLIRPDADVATTGWTTTPLFSKLNDSNDTTFVSSTAA